MKKTLLACLIALTCISCQEKKGDRFEREAKEYTKTRCPERIDDFTTLDSIAFSANEDEGNLKLYFSLALDSALEQIFYEVKDDVIDENLQKIRNSVSFIKYREAGVKFTYIYTNSSTGKELLRTDYTKDTYAQ